MSVSLWNNHINIYYTPPTTQHREPAGSFSSKYRYSCATDEQNWARSALFYNLPLGSHLNSIVCAIQHNERVFDCVCFRKL